MGTRKRDGFYKRDGSPYWWTRDPVTGLRCSTGYKDKAAAKLWRAARERVAADPAHAAATQATLGEWTQRFLAWKEKTASPATVGVARQKLGHWVRIFGASATLASFSEPSAFDHYTTHRRGEGASDHTISKEVAHMLAVLKLAKRAKCFSGDLSTLRPPDLHAGYKPRKRALNRQELARLLAALEPRRGALVAVCVALGCRLGEAFRLLPTDIEESRVFVRGTKTEESERFVPVLSLFRPLLDAARPYLPLEPWGKVQRDLKVACKRAGIDPCSPNDLRRTHATLLAEAGVDADVTRRLLGHTTRNLVDRVYGQPSTEALAGLAEGRLLGAAPLLPEGLQGSEGRDTSVEAVASGEPEPLPEKAGILSSDVTVDWFDYDEYPRNDSELHAEAPVAQWTEQRFPKPSPAIEQDCGILGFRGDARRWIPADEPGFGRDCRSSGTAVSQ